MINIKSIWNAAGWKEKLILFLGLIYLLSPIDLIPEAILGPLGLLDDGGALLVMLVTLTAVYGRIKKHTSYIDGEIVTRK